MQSYDSTAAFQRYVTGTKQHPEQATRRGRRARRTDSAVMRRKSRRSAAQEKQQREATQQTLLGWARVYLDGHGTDAMRRNVTAAVHRQARIFSEIEGESFEASLKRVEGAMLNAQVKARLQAW